MSSALLLASSLLLSAPPIAGLDKVPEARRADVQKYVDTHPVSGKAAVVDVEALQTAGAEGGTYSDVKVLLSEQSGSDGGCRYREHTLVFSTFEKDGAGSTEGTLGEYASDCCALTPDFPCDRTGPDWMLHYERARKAKDGKALARLAYKSFAWKASVQEDGEVHTKTRVYTVKALEEGKGLDLLPAIDPLRLAVACSPVDEKGYFSCTASQAGNYITFEWRHVGDKTKKKFETKLIRITTDEH